MRRPARANPTRSLRWSIDEQVVTVVVAAATAAAAAPARRIALQALDVLRRLDLPPPVRDRLTHALLVDPRALDALRA